MHAYDEWVSFKLGRFKAMQLTCSLYVYTMIKIYVLALDVTKFINLSLRSGEYRLLDGVVRQLHGAEGGLRPTGDLPELRRHLHRRQVGCDQGF